MSKPEQLDQPDGLSRLSADEIQKLALAYIDRKASEHDEAVSKLEQQLGIAQGDVSTVAYRRRGHESKRDFLLWTRELVVAGNPAWTNQFARQELELESEAVEKMTAQKAAITNINERMEQLQADLRFVQSGDPDTIAKYSDQD